MKSLIKALKSKHLLWLVVVVMMVRLITLGSLPILDPSEGRYAVIGQTMLLSGDLVTPHTFEDGTVVPFLAKPILHSWLTSSSFFILGVNEFAARFPSFAASVLICIAIFKFLRRHLGDALSINSLLIAASSALFFIMSGACLVDITLTLGTVLICVGFGTLSFSEDKSRFGGYLMFLGAVIGFLSKGPIALVLAGGPIFLWILTTKNWAILRRIPWVTGMIFFLVLTVPWFLMAEKANPGFSEYFFVHENFLRFVSSKYGDRYGSGHRHPLGAIWLMYLGAFLPWSFVWIKALIFDRKSLTLYKDHFKRYILLCALFPAIFFTVGKQTSIYYVLPGLPWLAALTAMIIPIIISQLRTDVLRTMQMVVTGLAVFASICLLIFGLFSQASALWALVATLILCSLSIISAKLLIKLKDEPYDVEGYPRCFAALTSDERDYVSSRVIASCAVGTVMVLSVFTTALSARISAQESTRDLVEKLRSSTNFRSASPVFLRKIPHSAYFYSRLGTATSDVLATPKYPLDLSVIIETKDELESARPRFVVGTKRDVKKMGLVEKGWISVATIGAWSIFEPPPLNEANLEDATRSSE